MVPPLGDLDEEPLVGVGRSSPALTIDEDRCLVGLDANRQCAETGDRTAFMARRCRTLLAGWPPRARGRWRKLVSSGPILRLLLLGWFGPRCRFGGIVRSELLESAIDLAG